MQCERGRKSVGPMARSTSHSATTTVTTDRRFPHGVSGCSGCRAAVGSDTSAPSSKSSGCEIEVEIEIEQRAQARRATQRHTDAHRSHQGSSAVIIRVISGHQSSSALISIAPGTPSATPAMVQGPRSTRRRPQPPVPARPRDRARADGDWARWRARARARALTSRKSSLRS